MYEKFYKTQFEPVFETVVKMKYDIYTCSVLKSMCMSQGVTSGTCTYSSGGYIAYNKRIANNKRLTVGGYIAYNKRL